MRQDRTAAPEGNARSRSAAATACCARAWAHAQMRCLLRLPLTCSCRASTPLTCTASQSVHQYVPACQSAPRPPPPPFRACVYMPLPARLHARLHSTSRARTRACCFPLGEGTQMSSRKAPPPRMDARARAADARAHAQASPLRTACCDGCHRCSASSRTFVLPT